MLGKAKERWAHVSKAARIGGVIALLTVAGVAASPGAQNKQPLESATVETVSDVIEKKVVEEKETIPFKTTTTSDGSLPKGEESVDTEGQNGTKILRYEITLTNGKETDKKLLETKTSPPIDKVIRIGTYVAPTPQPRSDCDPNYSPCIPNVSYDLDCPDIGISVSVIGSDPHGFDRDNDGYGCENN